MAKQISGSVRPRPNAENVQYYNLTLELGTDPATGKRKRLYFKINTTDKQEAENELMIKKAEYLQEKIVVAFNGLSLLLDFTFHALYTCCTFVLVKSCNLIFPNSGSK